MSLRRSIHNLGGLSHKLEFNCFVADSIVCSANNLVFI